jgi:cytochrome b pre-mRNA-processing protein 3
MFAWFTSKRALAARAAQMYQAISADARAPNLYAQLRVPDTTDGRFEMLALHMVLAVDRLGRMGPEGEALSRALTEAYIIAMDDTMRAIGVGDLTVPRKVKKAAAGVYDRLKSFGPALVASSAGADTALGLWHDALKTVFTPAEMATSTDLAGLAQYASERTQTLARLPDATLLAGRLSL